MLRLYKNRLNGFIKKHLMLIKRRGGLRNHIKLSIRFAEIDADPWVQKSRAKYQKKNSYPRNKS